ncbi:hypothetical protein GCM10023094_15550 [Rhodococcus olei]|uniref:EVE domain-containing protein n=1 Tax=Rhodococcus olei TaxID=2161675 RepID=A0ABP8NZF9_9NOCA
MTKSRRDVGCWIVKCNPGVRDCFGSLGDGAGAPARMVSGRWSLSARSARTALIESGDLVALWITGPHDPGIYEFGRVTSDGALDWPEGFDAEHAVDREKAASPCSGVEFDAVRLDRGSQLPRAVMGATPVLQRCEQFRAPRMSNPSFLTPDETAVLTGLLADRVPAGLMSRVGWNPG